MVPSPSCSWQRGESGESPISDGGGAGGGELFLAKGILTTLLPSPPPPPLPPSCLLPASMSLLARLRACPRVKMLLNLNMKCTVNHCTIAYAVIKKMLQYLGSAIPNTVPLSEEVFFPGPLLPSSSSDEMHTHLEASVQSHFLSTSNPVAGSTNFSFSTSRGSFLSAENEFLLKYNFRNK